MAFLSGLFRQIPAGDFSELATGIVNRFSTAASISPLADLASFRAALEAAHSKPLEVTDSGAAGAAMGELRQVADELKAKHYVVAIVQARELMSRHRSVIASCLNIIGAAYFELAFYREAVRHYAAAARFDGYFDTMVKNLNEVHAVLHANTHCRLSRLALAVLATDAFDAVIDESKTPKEVIGALMARGEVARRLGAPHLALQDFSRADRLGEHTATKSMIVLAAADLGDPAAIELAPRAQESSAFHELQARLQSVLPQWEAAAREEWKDLLPKLEALEKTG